MSTEQAQRRVLEAMAGMHEGGSGITLSAFALGLRAMSADPGFMSMPAVVELYRALAVLADAVREDLTAREESR